MAAQPSSRLITDREISFNVGKNEASSTAVSWAAVIGGAFVAASLFADSSFTRYRAWILCRLAVDS